MNTKYLGFTLIELIVTMAIAGIMLGIAIPSFNDAIVNSRLTTVANKLMTSLNIAKSEAIKRGYQITIRRKGATEKEWHSGWDIFVDINSNEAFNDDGDTTLCETNADGSPAEDCLLKTFDALPTGLTLITGGSTYKDYAAYSPSGMSTVVVGDTFHLCQDNSTAKSREIKINSVGRAYVKSPAVNCS